MDSSKKKNALNLGKGSRVVVAVFSFVFGLMMLPMVFDPPKPELGWINVMPTAFCFLVVGACVFPKIIRGYCGDVIALIIIFLSVWFFFVWYQDPNPNQNDNPVRFALVFGGAAIAYLGDRYGRFFSLWSSWGGGQK